VINAIISMKGPHGDLSYCNVAYEPHSSMRVHFQSKSFDFVTTESSSLFEAITKYRELIEPKGFRLLCNAARVDAYPSRMTLQMAYGRKIYVLHKGQPARRADLVDIFDPAPFETVGTINEQKDFFDKWLASLAGC